MKKYTFNRYRALLTTNTQGFYINLVVGAVFAPAYLLLFPANDPRQDLKFVAKLSLLDWPGTIIFLGGSTCLITAISLGGVVYEFASALEIALWTVAGVLFLAMIAVTKLHPFVAKEDRLYPAHFFKMPLVVNMQLQIFLSSGIILVGTPLENRACECSILTLA